MSASPRPYRYSNLNITIADGDRIGLVAGNGNGKTTLLRIIAGLAEPSTGDVVRSRGLTVGYVEQDVPVSLIGLTLYQAVLQALPMAERAREGWRVDVALDELETPTALQERLIGELSGGWQRIALLARCWISQPDALLLDEPTNHLDLAKLYQIERWMGRVAGQVPMVIASHDRDFLDATTNRTLFLRPETSRYVALPYSAARAAVAQDDAAAAAKFEKHLKEADKLRQQARKLTNIGINSGSDLLTVKAKQLKDRAGTIEAAARAGHQERSGDIRLSNSGTHAKVLVGIENATVTTPTGDPLFKIGKLHLLRRPAGAAGAQWCGQIAVRAHAARGADRHRDWRIQVDAVSGAGLCRPGDVATAGQGVAAGVYCRAVRYQRPASQEPAGGSGLSARTAAPADRAIVVRAARPAGTAGAAAGGAEFLSFG